MGRAADCKESKVADGSRVASPDAGVIWEMARGVGGGAGAEPDEMMGADFFAVAVALCETAMGSIGFIMAGDSFAPADLAAVIGPLADGAVKRPWPLGAPARPSAPIAPRP